MLTSSEPGSAARLSFVLLRGEPDCAGRPVAGDSNRRPGRPDDSLTRPAYLLGEGVEVERVDDGLRQCRFLIVEQKSHPSSETALIDGEDVVQVDHRVVIQAVGRSHRQLRRQTAFHFPDHRALCVAENATHNLHNILTLRGAVVRDARAWSRYLSEAIERFGAETDVVFASITGRPGSRNPS